MKECLLAQDSYIQIKPFMVINLNLSGNALLIYAVIYGHTVNKGVFYGSIEYLAQWCNCSTRNVITCLNKLQEQGLIRKKKTVRGNVYISTPVDISLPAGNSEDFSCEDFSCEDFSCECEKSSYADVKKVHMEGEKSSPNILVKDSLNNLAHTSACAQSHQQMNIGDLQKEIYAMISEHNSNVQNSRKIPISRDFIAFVQRESRLLVEKLREEPPERIKSAMSNFLAVARADNVWQSSFSFGTFLNNYEKYTPEYFDMARFLKRQEDSDDPLKQPDYLFCMRMKSNPRFDRALFTTKEHRKEWLARGQPQGEEYFMLQREWEVENAC